MKLRAALTSSRFSPLRLHDFLFLFALALLALSPAHGQTTMHRRVTQAIDENQLTTLTGHVRPAANEANDRGPVDDDVQVGQIILLLSRTPEQQHELDSLVDEMHNVHSNGYHRWLTPAEFG